jgi:hypothetical protein
MITMRVAKHRKLKVATLVVDGSDLSPFIQRYDAKQSPVLHNAVHTLLDGLKERDDIEIEVVYGRCETRAGENRRAGFRG